MGARRCADTRLSGRSAQHREFVCVRARKRREKCVRTRAGRSPIGGLSADSRRSMLIRVERSSIKERSCNGVAIGTGSTGWCDGVREKRNATPCCEARSPHGARDVEAYQTFAHQADAPWYRSSLERLRRARTRARRRPTAAGQKGAPCSTERPVSLTATVAGFAPAQNRFISTFPSLPRVFTQLSPRSLFRFLVEGQTKEDA